jgi:uncharacterized membrane protein YebE (DUF533 family)
MTTYAELQRKKRKRAAIAGIVGGVAGGLAIGAAGYYGYKKYKAYNQGRQSVRGGSSEIQMEPVNNRFQTPSERHTAAMQMVDQKWPVSAAARARASSYIPGVLEGGLP